MSNQDVGIQLLAIGDSAEVPKFAQNSKIPAETMPLPSQSQGDGKDAKSRFWTTYTREATDYDVEFLEKYQSDMDIVLIFAGLFSAVNTSFIVNQQSNLNPDPFRTTNALLGMLLQTANSSFVPQFDQPYAPWQGPSTLVIWIQSLIYASLCASLLAALGAVLGKQWLSNFKRSVRGTIDDRGRQRQMKLDGLRTWHFDSVLEFLPSLLQISLLLFGIALSATMWTMSPTIAIIIITSTTLGFTFYLTIILASLMAADCPFQTPGSINLRALGRSVLRYYPSLQKHRQNFSNTCLSFALYIPFKIIDTLNTISQRLRPSVTTAQQTDAPCIRWIIESSSDPDIITTAASFVPEVEWPPELEISPLLLQLFDTFIGCFENTHHKQLILVPPRRERAIACGKAFLHLFMERKSFLNSEDFPFPVAVCEEDIRKLIWVHQSDHEISFICYLIHEVVLDSPTRLDQPNIPDIFLCWMSHPLLHRLNDSRYSSFWHERALDAIARILVNPLPPKNVLANCFIAGRMLLGEITGQNAILKVAKSPTTALDIDILLELMMKQESREQSAIVLRLLEPLGVVLELDEYRQIAKDRRVAEWGLEVCKTFVRTAGQNQDDQDAIWNEARIVLHFTVIVAGDGPINQRDARLTWQGPSRLSIQEPTDCGWLIDYIMHYHNSDHIAVIDAMIALSKLPHVKFNPSRTPAMVEVIVSSLASEQPPALRGAALRAAHACRNIIFGSYMPTHLFPKFSAALHSALTESDSPRQHLFYLQILYSCAKSETWRAHILGYGHHSSHLHIANAFPYPNIDPLLSEHLALYIIANLQVMQGLSDRPLDLPDAHSCRMLVPKAWRLVVRQTGYLKETIEHLSAFTRDRLDERMILGTDSELIPFIRQTLGQLRLSSSDIRLISAVDKLLQYITNPQDSNS